MRTSPSTSFLVQPARPRSAPTAWRAGFAVACGLVVLGLATGTAAQAADATTPLVVDAGFNPAAAAEKGFTVLTPEALKGIQRVAVPVFAVEFITADNVTAQTSGFAAAGRASSSLYYKLLGVGQQEFQAMTDALYAQFLADLRASGVEVLGIEALKASPTYAKLVASGVPGSVPGSQTQQMSPSGLGIYGFARMGGGNKSQGNSVFGAIAGLGAGFSAVGAALDSITLAKELDASLIEVRMRVSFAQLTDENRGFFGRLSGTATASGKAFPSIDNVMMGVQNREYRSTLTMKHTLTLDNAAFAEVREKAATTGDIVGAVAVGLLRLAVGSSDSSSSTEMEVVADPEKYRTVIGNGLASVGSMLVARIQAGR